MDSIYVAILQHSKAEPELLMAYPESSDLREWIKDEILDKDADWIYSTRSDCWHHRKTLQTLHIRQCPIKGIDQPLW